MDKKVDYSKSLVREHPFLMNLSCKEIMKLDDTIRFVGLTTEKGQMIATEYKKNLDSLLSQDETEWLALLSAVSKEAKQKFSSKLGEIVYSVGIYDTVKRASIYLDDGFILSVSFELEKDTDDIILKILEMLHKHKPLKHSSFTDAMIALADQKVKKEKLESVGIFSSRLSHDLRNPLSIIQASLENLQASYGANGLKLKQFEKIEHAIDRMTHQIDDVLDFVRKKPIKLKQELLSEIITESVNSLYIPNNIKLIRPNNDVSLLCDKHQFVIVLNNLILNGIQCLDSTGTIEITCEENDDEVIINVQDSGNGIPKEDLNYIFEPLFTTKQTGTGLGLVSCKTIIENHGGTIRVNNYPTSFKITLPKPIKND